MHAHQAAAGRQLRTAFALTIVILAIEVVAGWTANSLALLSDAGHILTDVFSLGLAWFAAHLAARPPNAQNTFGFSRGGILAALLNAVLLILIAIAVSVAAWFRLQHPVHVAAVPVILAALAAVLVNAYIAWQLHGAGEENLNVRAALLHVAGDMVASAGVIVAGLAILIWHAYLADPILSVLIAMLIAIGALRIVRDTVSILMEDIPRGVDLEAVKRAIAEVPGVEDVHDLHIWALSDGFRMLTAHANVQDQSLTDSAPLLADIKTILWRRFHIQHATIELECLDCRVPLRRPIEFHDRDAG